MKFRLVAMADPKVMGPSSQAQTLVTSGGVLETDDEATTSLRSLPLETQLQILTLCLTTKEPIANHNIRDPFQIGIDKIRQRKLSAQDQIGFSILFVCRLYRDGRYIYERFPPPLPSSTKSSIVCTKTCLGLRDMIYLNHF